MEHRTLHTGVLSWRGVLAEGSTYLRLVVAGALALVCATPILTQWGYVGFQFPDGDAAFCIFLLMPVSIAAVLLGVLASACAGLFVGTVLYLHSVLAPTDYFELVYVTPVTSVVAMTACATVLGLLFSLVLRGGGGKGRGLKMALASLVASCVFSTLFDMGVVEGLTSTKATLFQLLGNAAIMWLSSRVGLAAGERGLREAGDAGLRALFSARLSVLVTVAFMVLSMAAYNAITARELASARVNMLSEVNYLLGQVERIERYDEKIIDALLEDDTADNFEKVSDLMSEGIIYKQLTGYSEEVDGIVVVTMGDSVIGSDTERIPLGGELADFLYPGVLKAADRSIATSELQRVIYEAPCTYSNLVNLTPLADKETFEKLLTPQVGYLMAVEHGWFRALLILPESMVFADRNDVLNWVFLSSVVLLLTAQALAGNLLSRMVGRRIDATNQALARITAGELETRVAPGGTVEFVKLSEGINTTVDALQGWIAEAESRMDAELATAKAIQASALPSVFPPFPDIPHFDIYATMHAAREVGGDFYDFFLIGDGGAGNPGKLVFVMADVSGKGVPAALFMMKAKTQIRDYLENGMELGEAIENANKRLCEGNEADMFVTVWVGILDYETRRVDYVNAGHNPPLMWHAGSWGWVRERSGLPLGMFDGMPYKTHSLKCDVGDQILLYTDGVTEAFSVDEEQYGEERLERLVDECFALHPRELVGRVQASVAEHAEGAEQSDDITIMALEVGVPPEEEVQLTVVADPGELERVREFVHAQLDQRLCPARVQDRLDVAVGELFADACERLAREAAEGEMRFVNVAYSYGTGPSSITVEFIDDAAAIDVEGGLGESGRVRLAQDKSDDLRYERVGDSNVFVIVERW